MRVEIDAWRPPVLPFVARLRAQAGHSLLVLPSVTVLVADDIGRLLLIRELESGQWTTLGGVVDVDEDPAEAAQRQAEEGAGVVVDVGEVLGAFGGPDFRVRAANGDETAYITTVYAASVRWGTPHPDGDETSEVGWFWASELATMDLHPMARATLAGLGLLPIL